MSARALRIVTAVVAAALVFVTGTAWAHESGVVYIMLRVGGDSMQGEADLVARDALALLSLPVDLGDEPASGELRTHEAALVRRVESALDVRAEGRRCEVRAALMPGPAAQAGLVRTTIAVACPVSIERVAIRCDLMRAIDPRHRAFVAIDDRHLTHSAVLSAKEPEVTFDLASTTALGQFAPFLREGLHHVLTGFDHLLFLAALLLPAALVWQRGSWKPRESARSVLVEVAWVASAFTLAHSMTLAAAALGAVRPPPRLVESAIALTVLFAALNNFGPFLRIRSWQLAFALGLVHGFGFAAQLGILGLSPGARAVALLGFNVGVELGQLAAIAVCLPVLLSLRRARHYRLGVLEIPSFVIAWVAGIWFVERAFGVALIS